MQEIIIIKKKATKNNSEFLQPLWVAKANYIFADKHLMCDFSLLSLILFNVSALNKYSKKCILT